MSNTVPRPHVVDPDGTHDSRYRRNSEPLPAPQWGEVEGVLANQADLAAALDGKADSDGLADVATTGEYGDLSNAPSIPAQFNPIAGTNVTLTGSYPDITFHSSAGGEGGSTVDSVNGQAGIVTLDADDIDDTSTVQKFVTSGDLTKLANLSGINTGDQNLSAYALTSSLPDQLTDLDTTVTGAQLNTLKAKVDNIAAGAEVNVQSDWTAASGDAFIANKPVLGTAAAQDATAFAPAIHNHDSVYYTEPEIDGLLSTKIPIIKLMNAGTLATINSTTTVWGGTSFVVSGLVPSASYSITLLQTARAATTASVNSIMAVEINGTTYTDNTYATIPPSARTSIHRMQNYNLAASATGTFTIRAGISGEASATITILSMLVLLMITKN